MLEIGNRLNNPRNFLRANQSYINWENIRMQIRTLRDYAMSMWKNCIKSFQD